MQLISTQKSKMDDGQSPIDPDATLQLEAWLPYRLFRISARVADVLNAFYGPRFGLSRSAWRTMAIIANRPGDGGHLGTALHTCLSESLVDADELIAACDRAAPRWNYASGAELFAALLDQAQMPAEPVLVG